MGCLSFVKVNAWVCMHWSKPIKLAAGQLKVIYGQCIPMHLRHKPKQSIFNYNYAMTPHILCSNLPQIHLSNYAVYKFQFLPCGMHRFQQTMSTTFTLNVYICTPSMCRLQQTMSTRFTKHSMFITTDIISLHN